jgi:hypothetical protein
LNKNAFKIWIYMYLKLLNVQRNERQLYRETLETVIVINIVNLFIVATGHDKQNQLFEVVKNACGKCMICCLYYRLPGFVNKF